MRMALLFGLIAFSLASLSGCSGSSEAPPPAASPEDTSKENPPVKGRFPTPPKK